MATSASTITFLLDQLRDVRGMSARKMFGEYALYCGEKVVALVCDDQLFVKITSPGKALVGDRYLEGCPYPGAKPWILVDAGELDDHERLSALIGVTAAALPAPKPKRKPGTEQKPGAKHKPGGKQKPGAKTARRAAARTKASPKNSALRRPSRA